MYGQIPSINTLIDGLVRSHTLHTYFFVGSSTSYIIEYIQNTCGKATARARRINFPLNLNIY